MEPLEKLADCVLKRFTPYPLSFSGRLFARLKLLCATVMIVAAVAMMPTQGAHAQGLSIIRDAEIEGIIRAYATPLFEAAGLNPGDIRIRLINDPTLNAFVAGGQNIYIHTGLILESDGPDALIGVIAHETGHIEGGHLSRTSAALEDASAIQMIGTILGVVAAVGAGSGDVGQAVILGSQSAGVRSFLKYSRTQESAADQAAMRLLDDTGRSAKGLASFLGTLEDQEVLSTRLQDPYAQTHPLSRDRLDTLRAHIQSSPYSDNPPSDDDVLSHAIMVAKLYAFINPLQYTLRTYPESDQSFPARYARAIAYYRNADLKTALPLLDSLIEEMPRNPFLQELKGQMLFEHARPREALEAYREAVHQVPNEPLLLIELARVELETGDPELIDAAIEHFRQVHRLHAGSSFTWRQLGIAYGRKGDVGMSSLALAEAELRAGNLGNAKFQAQRAEKMLESGTSAHLQAQDVLKAIEVALARRAARDN